MKKVLLSVLFLGAIGFASAQVVSNFDQPWPQAGQSSTTYDLYNLVGQGKAVVVIFYTPSDATSQQLAKDLNQIYYNYGPDVMVLGCPTINETESNVQSFTSTHNVSYPSTFGYNPSVVDFQGNYRVSPNAFNGATTAPFVMIIDTDTTAIYIENGAAATANGVSTALQGQGFNPTGISAALKEKGNFTIFPNPATDRATIKFMADNGDDVSLEVFNVLGEKIESKSNFNNGLNIVDIKTTEYANGVYFAKLKTGDNVKTIKFEVAR